MEQTIRSLMVSSWHWKFEIQNVNHHIFLCSSFSTYMELQEMMEFGPIIYNADGSCVNSILGRLLEKRTEVEFKSQNNLQTRYSTMRTWRT